MILQFRASKFDTVESRKKIVESIAFFLRHGKDDDFQPYTPNGLGKPEITLADSDFWTVDSGNDWKVKFHPETPDRLELFYRYQNSHRNPQEECLVLWLVCRLSAKVILPNGSSLGINDLPVLTGILFETGMDSKLPAKYRRAFHALSTINLMSAESNVDPCLIARAAMQECIDMGDSSETVVPSPAMVSP